VTRALHVEVNTEGKHKN